MPRVHSDHCAIILYASQFDFGPSPFRFFNSCLKDPEFVGILRSGWSISSNSRHQLYLSPLSLVASKLRNLKEHIKSWRKEVIEKVRKEMEELTNKINDIDLLAEKGQNAYQKIVEIESRCIEDLKQKSRTKWALEGDENSAFFHGLINKHQRSQRINGIKENGFWITILLTSRRGSKFRKLPSYAIEYLKEPFSLEEIKSSIWACGSDRAPGPDGFSFSFLKKHWEVQDPITINDYRPISLIGCLYKTISKVLVERLKKVVHLVVSTTHTAFIKNKNILDGPLILNEVISWLKKNKKKAFTFKVDFEEAFDSFSWEFLDSTMVSVIINGSATKEFGMERGIRQGDPLSPFLFIIAVEGLHIALESAKENGIFKGIRLPHRGPVISHLQYADDVIFMGSWSTENMKNLIRILRCFELSSGLKINMSKSKLYGFGVQNCELELVAHSFNCSIGSLPFTYLRLPVGASMAQVTHWKPIIEKFQAKLSRWKASTLSFGGRLTLCKVVLCSLGSFYFSIYKAPAKVIKSLERIRMRFFSGGCLESRKMAWIAWDKILAAKERGGISVGSLKAHNLALLGKWWWRFRKQPESIWALVIKVIHGPDGGISRPMATKRRSSCWGSIAGLPISLEKEQVPFLNYFQHVLNVDGSSKWSWSLDPSGGIYCFFTAKPYS
uniref:Reverse transcriptase domain-containing protein n=1 Tax=Lactuca sativa TaxID=4236 RepID=A0A9R1VRF1_LACSA|nr:hypothetical protein LSAT_V11C400208020 [Lactuca sativa]